MCTSPKLYTTKNTLTKVIVLHSNFGASTLAISHLAWGWPAVSYTHLTIAEGEGKTQDRNYLGPNHSVASQEHFKLTQETIPSAGKAAAHMRIVKNLYLILLPEGSWISAQIQENRFKVKARETAWHIHYPMTEMGEMNIDPITNSGTKTGLTKRLVAQKWSHKGPKVDP